MMSLMHSGPQEAPFRSRRVLLIENGPRDVGTETLAKLYQDAPDARIDILTCFEDAPSSFDSARGAVLSIHCEEARRSRMGFIKTLCSGPYDDIAVLALGSPILAAWVLAFTARAYKRIVLIRTGSELQSVPLRHWYTRPGREVLAQFLHPSRSSTSSLLQAIVTKFVNLLLGPFAVLYLCLFTLKLHAARRFRKMFGRRIESV